MSGGSYDYLCSADDAAELGVREEAIMRMLARLAALGSYPTLAVRTAALLALLSEVSAVGRSMSRAWRAVEWCDSGDIDEESMRKTLDEEEKKLGPG